MDRQFWYGLIAWTLTVMIVAAAFFGVAGLLVLSVRFLWWTLTY